MDVIDPEKFTAIVRRFVYEHCRDASDRILDPAFKVAAQGLHAHMSMDESGNILYDNGEAKRISLLLEYGGQDTPRTSLLTDLNEHLVSAIDAVLCPATNAL